jgi:PAS domain S-box-containing protein
VDNANFLWHQTLPHANETDRIIGHIRIKIDVNLVVDDFLYRSFLILGLGFLRSLILASGLILVFYLTLTKPLQKLTKRVLRVAPADENASNDILLSLDGHHQNDELGELTRSIANVLDLVHQKQFDLNRLAIEKQRISDDLTALIDTVNAPIFGIDAQGKVNEWNQQAEKVTGFKKDDVMGRDLVADFITDGYKASVGEVLAKALKGEETANFEFPLFTTSGDHADVLLNSTSRRDASGQIIGVVGVGQDITELNQVRVEQAREREEASAQIIQTSKLATLGEMATSVAHELNQPLNVIRLAAGNSRRKICKGTAEPQYLNDKLLHIEEQTARAAAIIDHMRIFGREANENPEPIDARNVVTNALDLMGEQSRLAEIEIVTELAENCPSILGHNIQLEQVILNLLTNARDAMAESEGEAKITLRVFEEDEGVHITCEDTGGGIPEDALPRIFEPFYTTKEMGKGTGLGLSVSYGIVRDMNGNIVAKNIDDGARFTITLPIVS